MQKFWMVWGEEKGTPKPKRKHEVFELAQAEACRLATQYGAAFYVLEAVGVARIAKPPVEYVGEAGTKTEDGDKL